MISGKGPKRLEQMEGSGDIRRDKRAWREDAPIDMALGREVHHHLWLCTLEEMTDRCTIGDVHTLELIVRPIDDAVEIAQICRVRQRVDVDEVVLRMTRHQQVEEVRTDKPGTAGDDYSHDDRGRGRASLEAGARDSIIQLPRALL